jgi:glycosyltransferase involved in cell wall biosynthesis
MKIVILSFYSGYVFRGMETFADELARRLSTRHSVTVIQAGTVLPYQKPYRVKRIPVSWQEGSVGGLRKLFLDRDSLKIAWFTVRALGELSLVKPKIIVVGNGGWQVAILKLYCLVTGAKLVVSGQAGLGWDERWNLFWKPNLFVALSRRNRNWALRHSCPNQAIILIPNGVDLKKFPPTGSRIKTGLPRPVFVCVAGPERYKRVETTMRAVAQLHQGSLLLISQSSVYDQRGKQLLGKRFLRKSYPHDRLAGAYRAGDVFTLVSESTEAFGIAYLEAMACGLPVVATDDQLRREIVGKAGILVGHPEDSTAYAHALEMAVKKEWGDLPRNQAKKFSWDMIAKRYEEEFNKVQP